MSMILSKETIRRLIKDVKNAMKTDLKNNGIYYIHHETDILTGYALILGPENTPYFGGFYFFSFCFPQNYPLQPPVVYFHTNGSNIRFNPNLYRDGKVCVSILNTWSGEQWSSCQSLSTVLLSLCTLFVSNPIYNEPYYSDLNTKHEPECIKYNEVISFANFDIAICDILDLKSHIHNEHNSWFVLFRNIIIENFIRNYDSMLIILKNKIQHFYPHYSLPIEVIPDNISSLNRSLHTHIYQMNYNINYIYIANRITKLHSDMTTNLNLNLKATDDQNP